MHALRKNQLLDSNLCSPKIIRKNSENFALHLYGIGINIPTSPTFETDPKSGEFSQRENSKSETGSFGFIFLHKGRLPFGAGLYFYFK
ncbi:hypothetical protein BOQ62_06100 [Chryseobacterium sp. CH21]|nr:hypothetical protein BOQ62_06100 [Chryseobacterium sp. CH21]